MHNPYDVSLLTDTDADHRARKPPSLGGDDFAYAYGSPIIAPAAGVIDLADDDNGGSGGRMVGVRHAGGVRSEQLHASVLRYPVGTEVAEGQTIAWSGASAYGSDWGTDGAHIHAHFTVDGVRVGWLNYLASIGTSSSTAGTSSSPVTTTTTTEQEDEGHIVWNFMGGAGDIGGVWIVGPKGRYHLNQQEFDLLLRLRALRVTVDGKLVEPAGGVSMNAREMDIAAAALSHVC
jgi:hypothetical protein